MADACYYYGDHVPNFAQLKRSDPARVLPGYDYDVVTEEAILERMSVRDGRIVLPDGMSYRVLVLPGSARHLAACAAQAQAARESRRDDYWPKALANLHPQRLPEVRCGSDSAR